MFEEINHSFQQEFKKSFTDSLVQHSGTGIQKKPTTAHKKKNIQKMYPKCREKESQSLMKTFKGYGRKRLAQHFETPPAKRAQTKSHSPKFDNVTWDKEKVLEDLRNHPPAPPPINWQSFARDHIIPSKNNGQIAKEFAKGSDIDTYHLDSRNSECQRRKWRLIGGEITAPVTLTANSIKQERKQMVERRTITRCPMCTNYHNTTSLNMASWRLKR